MRLHVHHHADPELLAVLRSLQVTLIHFPRELEKAMTAATDHLTAAIKTLGDAATAAAQKIADELAVIKNSTDVSPEVEAAATNIEGIAKTLTDAVAAASAPPPV